MLQYWIPAFLSNWEKKMPMNCGCFSLSLSNPIRAWFCCTNSCKVSRVHHDQVTYQIYDFEFNANPITQLFVVFLVNAFFFFFFQFNWIGNLAICIINLNVPRTVDPRLSHLNSWELISFYLCSESHQMLFLLIITYAFNLEWCFFAFLQKTLYISSTPFRLLYWPIM